MTQEDSQQDSNDESRLSESTLLDVTLRLTGSTNVTLGRCRLAETKVDVQEEDSWPASKVACTPGAHKRMLTRHFRHVAARELQSTAIGRRGAQATPAR